MGPDDRYVNFGDNGALESDEEDANNVGAGYEHATKKKT